MSRHPQSLDQGSRPIIDIVSREGPFKLCSLISVQEYILGAQSGKEAVHVERRSLVDMILARINERGRGR